MKKFLTFQIALVWIVSIGLLLWFLGPSALGEIWQFGVFHFPVGAVFLLVVSFFGSKAAGQLLCGKSLDTWEIVLACLFMFGTPLLCFVLLYALLSSIGCIFF